MKKFSLFPRKSKTSVAAVAKAGIEKICQKCVVRFPLASFLVAANALTDASCQCKNCGNIYGQRLEGKSDDIKRPRKRAKHASQSSKQSSLCFWKERGEGLKVSGWTKLEHCLFVHTLKHFEETKDTFTTGDLHEMYNVLVDVTRKNLKFTQAGRL